MAVGEFDSKRSHQHPESLPGTFAGSRSPAEHLLPSGCGMSPAAKVGLPQKTEWAAAGEAGVALNRLMTSVSEQSLF